MSKQLKDVKSEKFTFIVIICILLFSLIYMSMYSVLMKDENKRFKNELEVINNEINLLIEVIPVKDSTIEIQKEKIACQVEDLKQVLAQNEISEQDKRKLTQMVREIKQQIHILKIQAKQLINTEVTPEQKQEYIVSFAPAEQEDTLLAAREKEIVELKQVIDKLKAKKPEVSTPKKLSAYYFVVLSSDKKNRYSRTDFLTIQLQLKGDLSDFGDKSLKIEVRDPANSIISSTKDRIKPSSYYIINYKFEPFNYTFVKGKYSIRIYSEDNDFQIVTFLTLV